ncbi:MAG: HYR domain-containing protein, partial [Phycisphaerae bacterium]
MRSLIVRGVCIFGVVSATAASAQQPVLSLIPLDSTTIYPEQTVELEVRVDDVVSPALRSYQIILEIVPDPGATGSFELADPVTLVPDNESLFVDDTRSDWVFFDATGTILWTGNVIKLMLGAVLFTDSVEVATPRYCATYIFKASEDALGDFYVRFLLTDPDTGNPATWLRDPNVNLIDYDVSPSGGVMVTVEPVPLEPPNDDCVNSQPISDGVTSFFTENATTDGPALDPSCDEGAGLSFEQDVWFDHVATCSGILTISTCDDADFNTRLVVYGDGSATCLCPTDNSFFLKCNDDGPGCGSGTSEVFLPATEGECFTIRVGGLGTDEGTGNITITCAPDECPDAQPLSMGSSVTGSTENTSVDVAPDCGEGPVDSPGVWYSITGTDNLLTAFFSNATYDTRLTVYEGDCGTLMCVGDADNAGAGGESVSWCSTLGTEYLILVHGAGGATGTFTLRVTDDDCDDTNLCTDDSCSDGACVHEPDYDDTTHCCAPPTHDLILIDDGNPCTDDICNADGSVSHPPVLNGLNTGCDDGIRCTLDECISGQCENRNINNIECTDDDDCPGEYTCGDEVPGFCYCAPGVPLELIAEPGSLPVDGCYAAGELLIVRVMMDTADRAITGAQFFLEYDISTLVLNDIQSGAEADPSSPFSFVLNENVNPILGTINYGISVPMLAPGTFGPATLASLTFQTLAECDAFVVFRPSGPSGAPNRLVDDQGGEVFPNLFDLPVININGTPPSLTGCPGDINVGADPGLFTAVVTWPAPTAMDSCDGTVAVSCDPPSLTVFSVGMTHVTCSAMNSCGVPVSCSFDVTVESAVLTVDVELSPTVAAGSFDRCITFDLWDCDGPPGAEHVTVEQGLTFVDGLASAVEVSIPGGAWECITARDTLHTLRSTAPDFATTDGINYSASFVGDWAFGGHWLAGGNLNDDEFIDILDFGILSPLYLSLADPSTACDDPGPHANINGDNRVDLLDLVFVTGNWLLAEEPDCCGTGRASASAGPVTAISIEELRRMGLGDMIAADLNRDGMLDLDDIVALMQGFTPPDDDSGSLRDGVEENTGKSS